MGAQEVMKAAADGYTIMLANTGVMVINGSLYTKLPYDTLKDFTPIARTAMQPLALLVNPQVKANTLQEFAAYAKANLVLVELDFPRKPQPAALQKANEALKGKYGASGFPTIVVLDSSGKQVWKQVGYMEGGPAAWIAKLDTARKQ